MDAPTAHAGCDWSLHDVCTAWQLDEEHVLAVYLYGSRVYGSATDDSDFDFQVVVGDECDVNAAGAAVDAHGDADADPADGSMTRKDVSGQHDATIWKREKWLDAVAGHAIQVLECLWLPRSCVLVEREQWPFALNKWQLRQSCVARAGLSWVKANKKMSVEKDLDLWCAKKSLWHSLRILQFAVQVAEHGRVVDYGSMLSLWAEIRDTEEDTWSFYKERHQKRDYNRLRSQLRQLCPKPRNTTTS